MFELWLKETLLHSRASRVVLTAFSCSFFVIYFICWQQFWQFFTFSFFLLPKQITGQLHLTRCLLWFFTLVICYLLFTSWCHVANFCGQLARTSLFGTPLLVFSGNCCYCGPGVQFGQLEYSAIGAQGFSLSPSFFVNVIHFPKYHKQIRHGPKMTFTF